MRTDERIEQFEVYGGYFLGKNWSSSRSVTRTNEITCVFCCIETKKIPKVKKIARNHFLSVSVGQALGTVNAHVRKNWAGTVVGKVHMRIMSEGADTEPCDGG